jgi:hypothetical protein
MKKWKVVLSIFVLLLAVGAGTLYYFLNLKEYNTADTKVDEIINSDYQIKFPGDDNSESPPEAQAKGQSLNQTDGTVKSGSAKVDNSGNGTNLSGKSSTGNKASKLTAADILAKYQPAFKNLESQVDGKLDSLLSYALNEYQAKKANGEDISYFYLYSKYNGAAKKLEESTDKSFFLIYDTITNELEKSGYSSADALPIKNHYLSLKKERRSALMNKALEHLK